MCACVSFRALSVPTDFFRPVSPGASPGDPSAPQTHLRPALGLWSLPEVTLQDWQSLAQVQLCLRPSLLGWFPGFNLTLLRCYGPAWWSSCCVLPWLPSLDLILTRKSWLSSLTLDLFHHHKLVWSPALLFDPCCHSQACLGVVGWGAGGRAPAPRAVSPCLTAHPLGSSWLHRLVFSYIRP